MKYVINKETKKRYCLHCSSYECICLPESEEYFDGHCATRVEFKEMYCLPGRKADKFIFYKQTLPNGRVIKATSELVVPTFKWNPGEYNSRKSIYLSNDIINKSFH